MLGSTGSVGRSALEVIAASGGELNPIALAAQRNTAVLFEQARRFHPRWIVVADSAAAARQDWSGLPSGCELLVGAEALNRVASDSQVDVVLAGVADELGEEQRAAL